MKKELSISILIFAGFLVLANCEDLLSPEPKGQLAVEQLATDKTGFISLLNGAYTPLASGGLYNGALWYITSKKSDNAFTWRSETDFQLYVEQPTHFRGTDPWFASYRGINRCNTILDRIGSVESISTETKKIIIGQTKFLRGLYYFILVRLHGGVPLITKEVKTIADAEVPRNSISEVYDQIKSDLSEAIELLPSSYENMGDFNIGMATKGSAQGLLAKVYLNLEDWENAVNSAEEVINSGEYALFENYSDNFFSNSENGIESIFEIQFTNSGSGPSNNIATGMAPQEYQGGADVMPTDNNLSGYTAASGNGLVQAFEPGDSRKEISINTFGLPNFLQSDKPDGSLYFVAKYFAAEDFSPYQAPYNIPVLRYSDILLSTAEALNEHDPGNPEIVTYVNIVRERAGLPALESTITGNQDEMRKAIRQERRVELSFEFKRYFDLNRWGILKEKLALQNVTVPSERIITHPITGKPYYLLPIPSSEFINNANLGEQNPGY